MLTVNPNMTHALKLEKITLAISSLWKSDEGFLLKKKMLFHSSKIKPLHILVEGAC